MGRAAWRRRKTALLVAVAVFASLVGVIAYSTNLLRRTEEQTIDARFSVRGPQTAPSNIEIVAIDNASLQEMNKKHLASNFPFPRRYDASVIDRLREAGARVIAIDLQFTQQTNEKEDNELIESVERAHGRIVLTTTQVGAGGETQILGGNKLLAEIGARPASARLTVDSDGTVRRFPLQDNGLKSFGVVTHEVASGTVVHASLFESGTLPIDFVGPPESFKAISFSKVLTGQYPPGMFRGKIVIVGATAPVLQDVHATATTNGAEMSGPEIWANVASTLQQGVPLRDLADWIDVLLIILLGALAPIGSLRLAPLRAVLIAAASAVVFTVLVQLAFNQGWIASFVYPLLALGVGTLGTLAVLYLSEAIERERVHDLFARFVPPDVVAQVVARTDDNLRLGAVESDCTVLFSDLRGFTSFSETQPVSRVIDVVNCYLNEMTEAIQEAGGTLISYMGDGIMALFGAPLEQPDHADRAVRAAIEMIGPRLDAFNAWLAVQGLEHSFRMGVGVNSGPVMAGSIGSERRVEYTALGDTTNTASRLEGMTKGSGHMLFVAQSTRDRMKNPPEDLEPFGELEVRGRTEKLPVWTIPDPS